MPVIRFITIFILSCIGLSSYGQDTIPPELLKPARDTFFECGQTTQLSNKLADWFNNAAGAIFEDNSGSYSIITNISLDEATAIFENSKGYLCGNTQKVDVIFSALDASGNISQPDTASFYTIDTNPPTYNSVPNVQYECHTYIRDTLIQWIQNKAGYRVTDLCADTVIWTTFTYGFFVGNNQISAGSGNIANGPYPIIPDGICEWTLKINFFMIDPCNNLSITPGTTSFSVLDTTSPIFIDFPEDIIVSCASIPNAIPPIALDGCTKNIQPILTESSTQDSNPQSCNHYNYEITRIWTATDMCGNSVEKIQKITVKDTEAPQSVDINPVSISCDIFAIKSDSIYAVFNDKCSAFETSFSDTVQSSGCTDIIMRTYNVSDVCGNEAMYQQEIRVHQDKKPVLLQTANNLAITCDDQTNLDGRFFEWVNNKGGSNAEPICGSISYFAAFKGSFDINDPTTFPGQFPNVLPPVTCPSNLNGWLRYAEVDFVYYDQCENIIVTSALFGLQDTIAPEIVNCDNNPQTLNATDCQPIIKIKTPDFNDACSASSPTITQKIVTNLTSQDPAGPEAIIDPVTVKLGPFNPYTNYPLSDGIVHIKLVNLDIDDPTEFFNIYDEDGTFIRTSPRGTMQCSSVSFDIVLDNIKMKQWVQDGYIDLRFDPNIIPGDPVFSINNICGLSSIEVSLSFDIDFTNGLRTYYILNNQDSIAYYQEDSISIQLKQGVNTIEFIAVDCANNSSSCSKNIEVKDNVAPVIICPSNTNTFLPLGQCQDTISIPVNFTTIENCIGNREYNLVAPGSDEAAFISFNLNPAKGVFEARNKQLVFNGVFPIRFIGHSATLEVEFFGDNNEIGESFEIFASDGSLIGSTTMVVGPGCSKKSTTTFSINQSDFNRWISNKQITFLAVPINGGNGINPCVDLADGATIDRISYIKARLTYSDASFNYSVSGATTMNNAIIPNDILNYNFVLNGGKNIITISTKDKSGNTGSCAFEVNVIDTEPPVALCKNAVVEIHPSGIVNTLITPDLIDNGSSDNCGDVQLTVSPSEIDCSFLGTNINVILSVMDIQGNESQCEAIVKVNPYVINPSYSSGLCSNDTLKLFANVPASSVPGTYTFRWQGPGNIEFFTENPIIPNPDPQFNGTYTLTVTGFNGCTAVGTVVVNIKPLTNPEIFTTFTTICAGEEIILSGTTFSGDVNYDWYEGIYPTGVLIGTTKSAEIIINPPIVGPHFYYLIARSRDCSSNPSALIKVTVEEIPVATAKDLFLSPCEGGQITLASNTSNPKFIYEWSGPGGYNATGSNPPSIKNVNQDNAGNYYLIIKNGQCISDTAITRVTILESPKTPVITGLDIICEGNTFSLIATQSPGSEKYEWYKNGVLFTTTQDNSLIIPNAQTSLQGDWTVRSFKGNCSSPISTVKFVGVDDILQIGVINSGPICNGDSVTLQATFIPNVIYNWSGPVNNIPNVYNPLIPGVPGDYSVTITTPTGCKNIASTTVSIIDVPEITALSSDVLACMEEGGTIHFKPSVFPNANDYRYEWSGPNNYSSFIKNAEITNVSAQDTGTYTLIVYNKICPSTPYPIKVQFNITPNQPIITSQNIFCENDTIQLSISEIIAGATYEWITPLGTVHSDTNFIIIPNANQAHAGEYSVITHLNGCDSRSSEKFRISVHKKPASPEISFNTPICFGDTIKLAASHINDAIYHWTGPGNTSFTGDEWVIINSQQTHAGTYSVVSEVNGCRSIPAQEVTIFVKDEIKRPAFIVNEINTCITLNSTLDICLQSNSLTPNATYTLVNTGEHTILSQSDRSCFSINDLNALDKGTYFLNVYTEFDGCKSTLSDVLILNVNIPPNIQAAAIENNLITCPGESIRLISKYGPPEIDIRWTPDNPDIVINNPTVLSPIVSNLQPGSNAIYLDYSVNGCPEFSRDTIRIYAEFSPSAENDNYHIQYGSNQIFNVLVNDNFPNGSKLTIVKQPEKGSITIRDNQIEFIPDVRSVQPVSFTYLICADFCDNLCSEASVFITFDELIECFAPSIFTPNNDGINDYFIIPCLETGRFPNNRVIVFNEWGVEVFSARQYKNDWDGTYGGTPLPAGTYFYIIETENNAKPINGFLILQR